MGLIKYTMDQEVRSPQEMHNQFVYDEADDRVIMTHVQDVGEQIQWNKEKKLVDDGYTKDRTMKRVATIPLIVVEKIMNEQGWNPLNPNESERLLQLLDQPEWSYLRTAEGKMSRKPLREYSRASTTPVYKEDKIITLDDWVGGDSE